MCTSLETSCTSIIHDGGVKEICRSIKIFRFPFKITLCMNVKNGDILCRFFLGTKIYIVHTVCRQYQYYLLVRVKYRHNKYYHDDAVANGSGDDTDTTTNRALGIGVSMILV